MDWITARRKCSIEHAWNTLCERVRSDIEIWVSVPSDPGVTVEFSADAAVAVITKNSPQTKQIIFPETREAAEAYCEIAHRA